MKAGKIDLRSSEPMDMPEAELDSSAEVRVWPWPARVVFMVAAALACWAVPVLIVYAIAF